MAVGHKDSAPSTSGNVTQFQNTHDTPEESRHPSSIPQIYTASLTASQSDPNLRNTTSRSSASSVPRDNPQGKRAARENHSSFKKKHSSRKGKRYHGHDDSTSMSSERDNNSRQSRATSNQRESRSYDRHSYDDDDSEDMGFDDVSIRHAFIRKVYLILMCMLIFAAGVISFTMFHMPTKDFITSHPWLVIVSGVLYLVLLLAIICCESIRRTVPINYFILALMTFCMSLMAACSAANFDRYEVLAAFLITAVICLALTLFAFQTKLDFTVISGGLIAASVIMMVLGLVLIFWRDRIAMIAYACLGAGLSSLFFVFDTQMIMGGNHKYAINPEEYIYAVITLFTDMINIFVMTLNIIGLSRGE